MTDNEIMKNLRCCADRYCKNCTEQGKPHCKEIVAAFAWDLMYNQKTEVERLQKENEHFADIGKMYSEIRAEAVKEFAERLCEDRLSNDPVVIAVKVELKEMVGE